MLVLSDRHGYAAELLPREAAQRLSSGSVPHPTASSLARELLHGSELVSGHVPDGRWRYLLLSPFSPRSQYDLMIERVRGGAGLPDRLVCVAGAGHGFHGSGGRAWVAAAGNLHLSVHFAPGRPVERQGTAFTVLAAVSVLDALDGVPGLEGRARIKWMNDVLLDGAKVAGVLAHTRSQEGVVSSAVLGIGLNVETAPEVERTPAAPEVGAVRDLAPDEASASRRELLGRLMDALAGNYALLLEGGYAPLLERYRRRSDTLGRRVVVRTGDPPDAAAVARGRAVRLGEGLELFLEGREEPVTKGRLSHVP